MEETTLQLEQKEDKKDNLDDFMVIDNFNWIIPQCCREGWASCPHVPKRQRKTKNNIGL